MTKKYPAKYIGCAHDGWERTELYYEYKGYEYAVIKYNNGCMDAPLYIQHKTEQEKIDDWIKKKSKPIKEWKYEGSAEEGFDIFMEYVDPEYERRNKYDKL